MKTKSFLKTFANTLLYSLVIAAAICFTEHTGFVKTLVNTYVAIELLSIVVAQIGRRKGVAFKRMVAMGLILGADVYSDTVLLKAQAFISDEKNKKFQTRPEFTKILPVFMKDRDYTIPNLAAMKQATTQATEALYLKKKVFTITDNGKACTHTGEQSGSAKVSVTFVTKSFVITSSFKQHKGNQVTQAMALANDLWNGENSLWYGDDGVDQYLLDYLEANKSGLNAGGSGFFDTTNDIMAITLANKNQFYNLVTADMQMNNYAPTYNEVHNTMWTSDQRYYVNQGAGNTVNTEFQFAGFEFFPSNLIVSADYATIGNNTYGSVHYIIPDGGVAILDWNEPLNRPGGDDGSVAGNRWYTMQSMARPEFTFDVHKIDTCDDTTANGGDVQDRVTSWEISFTFAVAKQPVAGVDETPIFKYGIMTDDTFTS